MSPIPYTFQPIDPEQSVHDAPLWRDGKSKEPRFSGELLLTLTAKTPLLVGNHQQKIDEKHSRLMPQMLDDGRVIIGAASLKGMLRASMASLLQAPMERVAEHHYTYRPNLGFGPNENPLREVRAAIVKSIEGEIHKIQLLPKNAPVVFVRNEAKSGLGRTQAGEYIQGDFSNLKLTGNAPRMRLESSRNSVSPLDHYIFLYRGGMDGTGKLANAFNRGQVYLNVLVRSSDYDETKEGISLPIKVLNAYKQTQNILADDDIGHLGNNHPLLKKLDKQATKQAILGNATLQVNQLVYVEIEHGKTSSGKTGLSIRSMGHHFQYRWGYTSSVQYKNRLLDGKGTLRPELAMHPKEMTDDSGAPQQLTANRLLFGYTADGKENSLPVSGHFKRLAGRIAFNTAIEDMAGKTPEQRFMENITLKVLGQPRPSAVEFYLKQTALPRKLTTYGDTLGEPGGDLAGRKFYRHQPDAKDRSACYASSAEKPNGVSNTNNEERGTVISHLSKPGSQFRCTLRFDSLRSWELGALLAALDPRTLETLFGLPVHPLNYAHKLGYGKPLGLGSVTLHIDKVRWQKNDEWAWQQAVTGDSAWRGLHQSCLEAFKEKSLSIWGDKAQSHIKAWLKLRRWSNSGRADYPTAEDKNREATIFNFHTNLRRDHAAARRGTEKNFSELRRLLETDA